MPPDALPFDGSAVDQSFAALARSTVTIGAGDLAVIVLLIVIAAAIAAYCILNQD